MGLFFKKKKVEEPVENVNTTVTGTDVMIAGEVVKEGEVKEDPYQYYLLFAHKISGFKEVPFNTFMLLVHDNAASNVTVNYEIDGNKKVDTFNRSKIQDITFNSRVNMDNEHNNISDEKKAHLMSEAMFGGHPLNKYFEGNALNYFTKRLNIAEEKVDTSVYYEVSITYLNEEDESHKLIFRVDTNPEKFVNYLKSTLTK